MQPLSPPANPFTVRGLLHDALGSPKVVFTARAFRNGVLVSTAARTAMTMTNPAGAFLVTLPGDVTGDITLELTSGGVSDPWIALTGLSLPQQNTDLGTIMLPAYLIAAPFRVTVHGDDTGRTPVSGASVRAQTALAGGDARASTKFARNGVTDVDGATVLSLIPGDTLAPRPYTLSVVPPAGSIWATECLQDVPAPWPGQGAPASLLRDVTLRRRPVMTGNVVSARGMPVAKVLVTAISVAPPTAPCLAGLAASSTTTDAAGSFTLPLDPGTYQLEYDPPSGAPVPRLTEHEVQVTMADMIHSVRLPAAVLMEGDVRKQEGTALPYSSIRIFEPRCSPTNDCKSPWLRAETQADANGHFRVVVADPGTN